MTSARDDVPVTNWEELRRAERRAAARSVAAVLALLSVVALLGTWTTDTADDPATEVRGLGYGLHLVARDDPGGAVGVLAAALFCLPVLLVVATAVSAALVAAEPRRRRATLLAAVGWAGTAVLLVVVLGIASDEDLVGGGTTLGLALGCCAAAGTLGAATADARLDRHRG